MTALSPARALQMARYLLRQFIHEHTPSTTSLWKGKAKAKSTHAHLATRHHRRNLVLAAGLESSQSNHHGDAGPVAGPSRIPLPPNPRSPTGPLRPDPDLPPEPSEIYRLMNDERLLVKGGVKPPRDTIVLCHGLYGFSTASPIPLFPSLKLHYWASVLEVLRDRMGADVIVVGVKGTGSIKERAEQMHAYLSDKLPKGTGVNFIAHSMGGLDVRHLISNIRPTTYTPLSLTTIGTPHRGSPFMDWCAANIGVGTATALASAAATGLPFSLKSPLLARTEQAIEEASGSGGFTGFTSAMSRYLLNIFDSPAYSNLTTSFLRDNFNPETPDLDNVKYTSVAGRVSKLSVLHPLWFPRLVLNAAAEKGYPADDSGKSYEGNDGLVSVKSAKWGEYIGAVDDTHHWNLRGEGGFGGNDVEAAKEKLKAASTSSNDSEPEDKGYVDMILPNSGWDWEDGLHDFLGLGDKKDDKSKDPKGGKPAQQPAKQEGKNGEANWDIAQAGQVLDWVTDLLPTGSTADAGKKQIEDARQGKNGKKDAKDKRDKFDLARFYGGLMLKLREDGF